MLSARQNGVLVDRFMSFQVHAENLGEAIEEAVRLKREWFDSTVFEIEIRAFREN